MVGVTQIHFRNCFSLYACVLSFFFFLYIYIYIYKADLSIIHCLNIVRCIIVYLKYIIIIMKFQKKYTKIFRGVDKLKARVLRGRGCLENVRKLTKGEEVQKSMKLSVHTFGIAPKAGRVA